LTFSYGLLLASVMSPCNRDDGIVEIGEAPIVGATAVTLLVFTTPSAISGALRAWGMLRSLDWPIPGFRITIFCIFGSLGILPLFQFSSNCATFSRDIVWFGRVRAFTSSSTSPFSM